MDNIRFKSVKSLRSPIDYLDEYLWSIDEEPWKKIINSTSRQNSREQVCKFEWKTCNDEWLLKTCTLHYDFVICSLSGCRFYKKMTFPGCLWLNLLIFRIIHNIYHLPIIDTITVSMISKISTENQNKERLSK